MDAAIPTNIAVLAAYTTHSLALRSHAAAAAAAAAVAAAAAAATAATAAEAGAFTSPSLPPTQH